MDLYRPLANFEYKVKLFAQAWKLKKLEPLNWPLNSRNKQMLSEQGFLGACKLGCINDV